MTSARRRAADLHRIGGDKATGKVEISRRNQTAEDTRAEMEPTPRQSNEWIIFQKKQKKNPLSIFIRTRLIDLATNLNFKKKKKNWRCGAKF